MSRRVLFGPRNVSMISRTTLSALSMTPLDDRTRIRLTRAYSFTRLRDVGLVVLVRVRVQS